MNLSSELYKRFKKLREEIDKFEREQIELALLSGDVDEAYELMKKSMKRRLVEEYLATLGEGE